MRRLALLGCWLVLAAAGRTAAAEAAAGDLAPQAREKARGWVRQLGDRNFRAREKAARQLRELGPAARPVLEEGARDADAEVRRRCEHLLRLALRTDTE